MKNYRLYTVIIVLLKFLINWYSK